MVSQPNDVTVPTVDASVYKMSSYHLPLIAPLAASRVGNGPQKLQEGHLDEKNQPHCFASREWTPEATGRTPRRKNQPRCFASRARKPRSYREAPLKKKPINTSPCQRVDSRLKPAPHEKKKKRRPYFPKARMGIPLEVIIRHSRSRPQRIYL